MQSTDRYLKLFSWYGLTGENLYRLEGIEDKTAQLFDQLASLAMADNAFNRSLPFQFINAFRGYRLGDASAMTMFEDVDRRAFFLSDFFDYLQLIKRI